MEGRILSRRYELVEKIAEGGMARVYRGRDIILKRTVAVKILKDQMTGDAAFVRRFEREAQSAAALSHPHIVNIYDVGEEDGTYFIIMEFVDGKNLKEYIREKGQLPAHEAIRITRQIAEALQHAHGCGVVHRDIKPQNILFSRDGKVKVTDFGIAIAGDGVTVTYGKEIVGSVQYISPEQARGEVADKQSDLYSLGIVLYEMITGQVPFSGEKAIAVAMKHIQEEIPAPQELASDLPESLEQVIFRAVEKDTADRYTTSAELLEDLFFAEDRNAPRPVPQGSRYQNKGNGEDDDDYVRKPGRTGAANHGDGGENGPSWIWLKVLLGLLLLASLAVGGWYYLQSYFVVPEVTVPAVRDLPQSEANRVLREAELVPNDEVYYIYDPVIAVGNVVKTEPPEGRIVRENRGIDLYISKGPEYIITPDLTGRTEQEAQLILSELDLPMRVYREYNDDYAEGVIYRQSPGESIRLSPGTEVTVFVSKGRGPFEIADLVGLSEEGAIRYLEEEGLRPRRTYRFSIGSAGFVIEQEPRAGEEVLPGQSVDLVIGQ